MHVGIGMDSIPKALLDLGRMQSMVDKVLEEGSFVDLLIGLIEGEVSIVLL